MQGWLRLGFELVANEGESLKVRRVSRSVSFSWPEVEKAPAAGASFRMAWVAAHESSLEPEDLRRARRAGHWSESQVVPVQAHARAGPVRDHPSPASSCL